VETHRQPAHRRPRSGHGSSRNWALPGGIVALCAAVAAAGIAYGVSRPDSPVSADSPAAASDVPTSGPALVDVYPLNGAANVGLDTPISLVSANGQISSVTVSGGGPMQGHSDASGRGWAASVTTLVPNTAYVITASTIGPAGTRSQFHSSFTTVNPRTTLKATITPNAVTVGVGEPIVVKFNVPVSDKASVQSHLSVTMSAPVAGAWHWMSPTEVHYRPQGYWPAGEKVSVDANLAGADAGNGAWGTTDYSASFTIGDSHVSTVDVGAHTMTVTDNGAVVRTVPVSTGRDKYPTMNGVHVVLGKQQDVLMDSATVGIPRSSPDGYYEHVFWDVAISTGGEYVHSAPWSVGDQGNTNVSHGCVNVAPDQATWFFGFSQTGDVVAIVNSPRPPDPSDRSTADWNMSWSDWLAGGAI
ncbi:MAG: Ig-like domain-containing protein, partial [Acidimicrobiales bacterium]